MKETECQNSNGRKKMELWQKNTFFFSIRQMQQCEQYPEEGISSVKQFNKFVDFYGLQDYSAWHLHIFLDQLHSTELREREHRFPCNEVMRSTSNSYNLSIINAANRKDED